MSVPTRRILEPIFGKPVLRTNGNGRAKWDKQGDNWSQLKQGDWAAYLNGGEQSSGSDWAAVHISVDEVPVCELKEIMYGYYFAASATINSGPGICIQAHNPDNHDAMVEINQSASTNTATSGSHEILLDEDSIQFFWFGNNVSSDCGIKEGTELVTWGTFMADPVLSKYTVFMIKFEYGFWGGDATTGETWITALRINNTKILMEPSSHELLDSMRDTETGAIKAVPTWMFGAPSLASANNGSTLWVRTSTPALAQKGSTDWLAKLNGGVQTNDDYARISIPVNEMPLPDFTTAKWSYYMSATQTMGVNIVIWVHDPTDFAKRAEITQLGGHADLGKTEGWNAFEFSSATSGMFFYGETTTGTGLIKGTQYTWSQFISDALFKTWDIYRITLEYGWEVSGTFDDVWVAEVQLNGKMIPLKPSREEQGAGYEFGINGINFNGYAKIKTLLLTGDCGNGGTRVTFHHYRLSDGTEENYKVPDGKVFIAYQALVWESYETGIAVIGETVAPDTGDLTKEILFLSNGTNKPSMMDCYGVFAAGSYVTARSITYIFKAGSALYGTEVDI